MPFLNIFLLGNHMLFDINAEIKNVPPHASSFLTSAFFILGFLSCYALWTPTLDIDKVHFCRGNVKNMCARYCGGAGLASSGWAETRRKFACVIEATKLRFLHVQLALLRHSFIPTFVPIWSNSKNKENSV